MRNSKDLNTMTRPDILMSEIEERDDLVEQLTSSIEALISGRKKLIS